VNGKRDEVANSMGSVAGELKRPFSGRPGDPRECQLCGAKTRSGGSCRRPAEVNPHTGLRRRCRLHAGWSSGPRTEAGKAAVAAAAFRHGRYTKAARAAKRELRVRLWALKQEASLLASGKTPLSQPRNRAETPEGDA